MKQPTTTLALTHNGNGSSKRALTRKSHTSRARTRIGQWRSVFLRALAKTPSVTFAAKAAGVSRRTVYDHRERDEEFAARWDDSLNQSLDVLEHEVYQRAIKGDAQLAMFILRAHRPSTYRETSRVDVGLLGGIVLLPSKSAGPE
jgi:hypothetical protein